jgi:hypothetical protein
VKSLVLLALAVTTAAADPKQDLETAFAKDAKARALALALYDETGGIATVGPKETMNGGYRGMIELVPQLPTGKYRKHLQWTLTSLRHFGDFFTALYAGSSATASFRTDGITFRFIRSLKKRTPSAFAFDWIIAYNVNGSLMKSAAKVEETLFHEIFHLNDIAHATWSQALSTDYDAIVAKCGTDVTCLAPYAPNTTKVRGGTYYAFQQDNGSSVGEYGAELAVRYWREHQRVLAGKAVAAPFKCGPPENRRAWDALVAEFFDGRDLVPPCS